MNGWTAGGITAVVLIVALFVGLGYVIVKDNKAQDKFKQDCAARGGSTLVKSESQGKTVDTDEFCISPDGRIIDFRD